MVTYPGPKRINLSHFAKVSICRGSPSTQFSRITALGMALRWVLLLKCTWAMSVYVWYSLTSSETELRSPLPFGAQCTPVYEFLNLLNAGLLIVAFWDRVLICTIRWIYSVVKLKRFISGQRQMNLCRMGKSVMMMTVGMTTGWVIKVKVDIAHESDRLKLAPGPQAQESLRRFALESLVKFVMR